MSRSRANAINEDHFYAIRNTVHNKIQEGDYKDRTIVVSLCACVFHSDAAGGEVPSTSTTSKASEIQHIFSNKSTNVYRLTHFDLREQEAYENGRFAYDEIDFLIPKKHAAGEIRAMMVNDDPPSVERVTLPVSVLAPVGSQSATAVSVGGASAPSSPGADVIIASDMPITTNLLTERGRSAMLVVNDPRNPAGGHGLGVGRRTLDQHPEFQTWLQSEKARGRFNSIDAMATEDLAKLASTTDYTDPTNAKQERWLELAYQVGSPALSQYADYLVTAAYERLPGHTTVQRDIDIPHPGQTVMTGRDTERPISALEAASFKSPQELKDLIRDIRADCKKNNREPIISTFMELLMLGRRAQQDALLAGDHTSNFDWVDRVRTQTQEILKDRPYGNLAVIDEDIIDAALKGLPDPGPRRGGNANNNNNNNGDPATGGNRGDGTGHRDVDHDPAPTEREREEARHERWLDRRDHAPSRSGSGRIGERGGRP